MNIKCNGKELNGRVKQEKNEFFLEVENGDFGNSFENAITYMDELGIVTCINGSLISKKFVESINGTIATYRCGYVITENFEYKNTLINTIHLHFKELDAFFIKYRYRIDMDLEKNSKWELKQKLVKMDLYKNEKIKIFYYNIPHFYKNDYGENIYNNYWWIGIEIYEPIKISEIDKYIHNIENCFGFVLKRKINLCDLHIIDNHNILHRVFMKNMKKYDETIWEDLHVVDLSSLGIVKKVLKRYYEDILYSSCINTYYEYLYNNLDMVVEFTSVINLLEMFYTNPKYSKRIIKYAQKNNEILKSNIKKMNNILKKVRNVLNKEEIKFLDGLINKKFTTLNDKLEYIFFVLYSFEKNEKSKRFISEIRETRKFFVHGGEGKKKLENAKLFLANALMKEIAYVQLMREVTRKDNINIRVSKETIEVVYNSIINNIN